MADEVAAHDQHVTHAYVVRYPAHPPRRSDPHYLDFEHYRRRTHATAKCAIGEHRNDFSECDGPLELHHAHVEFALQNGVDLAWLEVDYPGISDPDKIGSWVESARNLMWLCLRHHRGDNGIHVLSAADFEAQKYVRDLIG
ncbi:hypothetical protein E2F47_06170 [Mycobacterium eburneum]|nr:hypothetical protein [Mycobacterium eburneum]TDH56712.1 hypothetical protein E2F47_06170 [Mycobacterium eburneum]